MLRTGLKSYLRGIGLELNFSKFRHYKKSADAHLYNRIFNPYSHKQLFTNGLFNTVRFPSFRCNSAQATVVTKNGNEQHTTSSFHEFMFNRKNQAQRSVLIEVPKSEDIPYALSYCEKFGTVKNAYSFTGYKDYEFLLLEFANEADVETLMNKCECKKAPDIIPVHSRLLQYVKGTSTGSPKVKIDKESIPESSLKPGASISEVIQDIYSTEKLTELGTRLRYMFCILIEEALSGLFPYCEALPFGSSVSGIGRHGCDVDVLLRLNSKVNGDSDLYFKNRTYFGKHKIYQQKMIFSLAELFRTFLPGIYFVEKILFARVPIVKMQHNILGLECDLSVDNLSPFHMSDVIYFCGEIDDRVRPLIYGVKKWAKEANVTQSTPGSWITNFGLTNLVLFFLQNRPNPILPSFNEALVIVGHEESPDFGVKYLKPVEDWKHIASLNKESLAELLKEFLLFLATEPFEKYIISLMDGKKRTRLQEIRLPLWIQYPFDEGLNITKNISLSEFELIRKKANISAKSLEDYLRQKDNQVTDLSVLLDIPSVSSIDLVSGIMDLNSSSRNDKSHKKVTHRTM